MSVIAKYCAFQVDYSKKEEELLDELQKQADLYEKAMEEAHSIIYPTNNNNGKESEK